MTSQPRSGVGGTLQAFNFIRRIGFPSAAELITIFTTLAVFSTLVSLPSLGISLANSLQIALALIVVPSLTGEFLNSTTFLKGDSVLNFRRLMGMELLSWWALIIVLPLTALVGSTLSLPSLWVYGFLLVLATSLPLRTLTVFAISPLRSLRKIVASVAVPVISFLAYLGGPNLGVASNEQVVGGALALSSGIIVSIATVSVLMRNVDESGTPQIGESPMSLFRAFLVHWLKRDPEPLETRLATLGSEATIKTSILAFEGHSEQSRGCIIVSGCHPGPYRDLGSGGLPSTLKFALESSLGTTALVPHGISNHEHNIISHQDISALLKAAETNYPSLNSIQTSSRLARAVFEGANASAQAFGNVVLLTLTLAPADMEDIPEEVSIAINQVAEAEGVKAIIVDAHNSLSGQTSITPEQAKRLVQAAKKALQLAILQPQSPFRLGVAFDPLNEFRLEDGIGPGGVSIITVQTAGQTAAYVTIDGNNMQTGFRDTLLDALAQDGLDEGEVMTTDTHLVTGLVRSPLGYHPVGEHIDNQVLIERTRQAFERAKASLGDARAGFSNFNLELRVLGPEAFQSITSFVSSIGRRVSISFFRLELATAVLALLILALV